MEFIRFAIIVIAIVSLVGLAVYIWLKGDKFNSNLRSQIKEAGESLEATNASLDQTKDELLSLNKTLEKTDQIVGKFNKSVLKIKKVRRNKRRYY